MWMPLCKNDFNLFTMNCYFQINYAKIFWWESNNFIENVKHIYNLKIILFNETLLFIQNWTIKYSFERK